MREIKYPVIKLLSLITVSLLSCNVDAIEKRRQDRPFLKGRRIVGRAKENPAIDLKKRFWT